MRPRVVFALMTGLGTGLILSDRPWGWPDIVLGGAFITALAVFLLELVYAEEREGEWRGTILDAVRIWGPLGRVVVPALAVGLLFHFVLGHQPSHGWTRLESFVLLAVYASAIFWRWRRLEVLVALAASATLAVHDPAMVPEAIPLVGLAWLGAWISTLSEAVPGRIDLRRRGQVVLMVTVLLLSAALGVGVRLLMPHWGALVPLGVGLSFAGWALTIQTAPGVRGGRARQAGLILTLGIAPGLWLLSGLLVWLVSQSLGTFGMWFWLRRVRPYMYRPVGPLAGVLASASVGLAIAVVVAGAKVGIISQMLGIGLWFIIPPLIDAYQSGRFPFRRQALPDPHTLPD